MTIRGLTNRFHMVMNGKWRDVCYDLKCKAYGLDLAMESTEALGLAKERCNWCSNSGGPDLQKVLDAIPLCAGASAIDIGCGKGGAMITMARYPFKQVVGVEISPRVAAIAASNIARMRLTRKCRVHCGDAADFKDLTPYRLIYMYNPFPQVVMEAVLDNIARSLAERSRHLTFIYKNPVYHEMVRSSGFETIQQFGHSETPYCVYRAIPPAMKLRVPAALPRHPSRTASSSQACHSAQ